MRDSKKCFKGYAFVESHDHFGPEWSWYVKVEVQHQKENVYNVDSSEIFISEEMEHLVTDN